MWSLGSQAYWPSGAARLLFYPYYCLSYWVSLIFQGMMMMMKQPTFNGVSFLGISWKGTNKWLIMEILCFLSKIVYKNMCSSISERSRMNGLCLGLPLCFVYQIVLLWAYKILRGGPDITHGCSEVWPILPCVIFAGVSVLLMFQLRSSCFDFYRNILFTFISWGLVK